MLWIAVTSSASSVESGGSRPGSRRASIVLPAPGGPIMRRLCPPADAISSARRAPACPRTSPRSSPTAELGKLARARGSGERIASVEGLEQLAKRPGGVDLDPLDEGGLGRVGAGDDGPPDAVRARAEELRKDAAQRLHRALERQLAHEEHPLQCLARDHSQRRGGGGGEREVEPAAGLLHVGRGEVDDDLALAQKEADLGQGALHADAALADRRLGEADELEVHRPASALDLDADEMGLKTDERCAERRGEHGMPVPSARRVPAREASFPATNARVGGVRDRSEGVRGQRRDETGPGRRFVRERFGVNGYGAVHPAPIAVSTSVLAASRAPHPRGVTAPSAPFPPRRHARLCHPST